MRFDVEAARRLCSPNAPSDALLIAACDEIERLRLGWDLELKENENRLAEATRLRAQLGIAAVALGRIADAPDRTDNHDERLTAQRALLRMREGE